MNALISISADVMGGVPVFAGSRLPISVVLDSLEEGVKLERLQTFWPFLIEAHIQAARTYVEPSLLDVLDAIRGDAEIDFNPPRLFSNDLIHADEVPKRLQAKLDAAKAAKAGKKV